MTRWDTGRSRRGLSIPTATHRTCCSHNLTVFSYSGRLKSHEWRWQRRRADLRHFEIFRHGPIIIYTRLPAGGTYYPICTFPASSECLISIFQWFLFCLLFTGIRHLAHVLTVLPTKACLQPVLNWANVCSPEHTSDTSTNYDSFLNWTFSSPNMVRTVQTLLHSQLACNEMQASARTCGRRAADSMMEM